MAYKLTVLVITLLTITTAQSVSLRQTTTANDSRTNIGDTFVNMELEIEKIVHEIQERIKENIGQSILVAQDVAGNIQTNVNGAVAAGKTIGGRIKDNIDTTVDAINTQVNKTIQGAVSQGEAIAEAIRDNLYSFANRTAINAQTLAKVANEHLRNDVIIGVDIANRTRNAFVDTGKKITDRVWSILRG